MPVRAMLDTGVPVGLGVDGSASNDMASLVAEARQAMLLQRVSGGADQMSAREALEIATVGGAEVLGRDDIGKLANGYRADVAVWDVSGVESAGSWDVAALLLAGPVRARAVYVEGRQVVADGRMLSIDHEHIFAESKMLVRRLMD